MTRKEIREKVRKLIRKTSGYTYSDTELNTYINNYYRYELPEKVTTLRYLETWFQFNTSNGDDGAYSVPDAIRELKPPITVDGTEIVLYVDAQRFFTIYPRDTTFTAAEPTDALYYNRTLYLRPPPDDTYTIKVSAYKIPDELSSDSSYPVDYRLGKLIAVGTAIDILEDNGDFDLAQPLAQLEQQLISLANKKETLQYSYMRATPRF